MSNTLLIQQKTNYRGSEDTIKLVSQQIKERWGDEALSGYDPTTTARTFHDWKALGYKVKKGEKALKSYTYIEKKDDDKVVIGVYRKTINLFLYPFQVEKDN